MNRSDPASVPAHEVPLDHRTTPKESHQEYWQAPPAATTWAAGAFPRRGPSVSNERRNVSGLRVYTRAHTPLCFQIDIPSPDHVALKRC